ncbi:ABC transporter substrate-binding protein [Nocardiopsis ansamitocini]|uniref:Lipoprotein n=1 Tax=Nocardiopsis ansamitocini TaxID=1670832 RepID=A0A9W6UIB2_9ACTN|nr:ABC transporter substrate-binding protein [Nocardiopsis ansamitocini]GLU46880.1 lipoprotein [Nocardiopsis ansamitocini]
MTARRPRPLATAAAACTLALVATACGTGSATGETDTLTLGYFPNITHAPALVGVENGILADALGADVELDTQTFNAGPDAINALFAGEIDATFIGPNPAINGWSESSGTALHIIAGSTSRGAGLVARPGIESVDDLEGTTISTPQLGNTQDVALRWWAQQRGWEFDTEGGGDISIVPQGNSEIVQAFLTEEIDAAWVPEPHLSRLLIEGEGNLLVDEADEWADTDGEYVTTHLIVNQDFLEAAPDLVAKLLSGHVETVAWINDNSEDAQTVANDHLEKISGDRLDDAIVASAFENLSFTTDPVAESLRGSAEHAEAVGLLEPVDLEGIYALDLLNEELEKAGQEPVSGF